MPGLKSLLKKFDVFCTTELLRYKADSEYSTAFGGFASIVLIGVLMTIFSYKLISCFLKEQVKARQSLQFSQNPGPLILSTSAESQFMLAIQIYGVDLSQYRYFDLTLRFTDALTENQTIIWEFQPCQKSHWEKWPSIASKFQDWNMGTWACLPPDTNIALEGSWMSQVLSVAQLWITKCTDNDDFFNLPCPDQGQVDQIFTAFNQVLVANIYFINPTINPQKQNHTIYDISDNYYVFLSRTKAATSNIYFSRFSMTTDQSIFPWDDKEILNGSLAFEPLDEFDQGNHNSSIFDDMYAYIRLMRSKNDRIIQRSYVKLEDVLGFIGGLFGTACIFLVFVNQYSKYAYEISLGNQFFKPSQTKTFKKYNFFSFVLHKIYEFFNKFGCSPKWESTAQFSECQAEMEKQLDISYLLERIEYLENVSSTILDTHQLRGLHIRQKLTLSQAKKKRRAFKLKRKAGKLRRGAQRKMSTTSISQIPGGKYQANTDTIIEGSEWLGSAAKHRTNQSIQENKDLNKQQDNEQLYSASSSESQEQNHEEENEIVDELIQLKDEASKGNKLSEKVLQITAKSIHSALPGLLFGTSTSIINIQDKNTSGKVEDSSKVGAFLDQRSAAKIRPFRPSMSAQKTPRN